MNVFHKIGAAIIPFYKQKILIKEQRKLFNAIVLTLPDEFETIQNQTISGNLLGLDDWALFPDFKFTTIFYGGNKLFEFKKRGQNFKISGLEIFSNKTNQFENIEILIHDNLINGLKIYNADYKLGEFNLSEIKIVKLIKSDFKFPPSEVEIFYDSLAKNVKQRLDIADLFDIDFNNRTFYAFYDLEDGNYLAVDKKANVYSLVHDAKPAATKMGIQFYTILEDIQTNKFNKESHLANRYKSSKWLQFKN